MDNDVDENSLAATGEENNLDRDTALSGNQASAKPNIDIDIGAKRSEDEEVLMQFLQDSENNWMRNRRQGRHASSNAELLLNLNPLQFHLPRPPTSSASASALPTSSKASKPSQDGKKSSSGKTHTLPTSASDSSILEDIQSRFNRLTEADTLEHIQARFNELAAQTFSTLAAANAAVSSEIEARARQNAEKADEQDPLDLSLESGPLDDLSYQLENVQFPEFPSNQPPKGSQSATGSKETGEAAARGNTAVDKLKFGSQEKRNDRQKVEKEKENAKTKEQSDEKKDGETQPSPNTNSSSPQVEFSLQSGPNSPRSEDDDDSSVV